MKDIGRLIAALLTVGFGVLAIPFLALTTVYMLGGARVANATLLVFVVYAVVFIAVVRFWVRGFTMPRRPPTDRV